MIKPDSFFYNATVKHPTAITQSLRCNFTYTDDVLDINLVTVCSNTLKIYTINNNGIHYKVNSQFNDKIAQCVAVSSAFQPKRKRDIDLALDQSLSQDYLFVLTENFLCCLLCYSILTGKIEVVSRGCLGEKGTGERRERPYPIIVDQKFIALMLYENVIKIIPLVHKADSQYAVLLSNAQNVRVRHSEIIDIIPVVTKDSTCFAILYQKMEHSIVQQRPSKKIKREVERHYYNHERGDLTTKGERITFASNTVYKIVPLVIGGFLAFDVDQLLYYGSDFKEPICQQKLRSPLTVNAFCQVDQYNHQTKLTNQGGNFLRYLFSTEAGELFMLAFRLDQDHSQWMKLEYLAGDLSSASSLSYLDNSYLFYASENSDSYIIKITPELQSDIRRPFIQTTQVFESLAPIIDISLATPNQNQGGQSELLVTSGLNNQTYMTLVKKGIQVNQLYSFQDLPLCQKFCVADNLLFIKCLNYEFLLCLKAQGNEWKGIDCNLPCKDDLVGVDCLQSTNCMQLDQGNKYFTVVASQCVRLLSPELEIKQEILGNFTLMTCFNNTLAVCQNQTLQTYELQEEQLILKIVYQAQSTITAICVNKNLNVIYLTLDDAPFYSLVVLQASSGDLLSRKCLAQYVDILNMKNFAKNYEVNQDGKMNQEFECNSCQSIQNIEIESRDFLILGFGNGKVLKLEMYSYDQSSMTEQAIGAVHINNYIHAGEKDYESDENAQVYFVGTLHPKMYKVWTEQGEAVIAACDKPVIFYKEKDKIEMQYLATGQLHQVQSLQGKLVYEAQNQIRVGQLDGLQRLQMHRMLYKKQIQKSLLMAEQDQIVVILEEPNLAYVDETKPQVNMIAVVSRTTFKAKTIFSLKKTEVANCVVQRDQFIMVGTTFLKLEEQVPCQGRLLIFTNDLVFIQEILTDGSVQSIVYDKYLTLAVNNRINVYSLQFVKSRETKITLELLDTKQSGTFIHSITPLNSNTIIVADSAGSGITTFDLKEQRNGKIKLMEAASSHISMWVNQVICISQSQFIVFDQDRNMFVFQKILEPVTAEEKYKLWLIGSFCVNEEVKTAAFGSLRHATGIESQQSTGDVVMEELFDVNEKFDVQIRTDLEFARKIFSMALNQIQKFSQEQIVYGTAEGSIGTLFRLSPICYFVLELLQKTMDKNMNIDFTQAKRIDFRSVKQFGALPTTVIDGDFVETFLQLSRQKQLEIVMKMMAGQQKGDETLADAIVQLLDELIKIH